MAFRQLPSDNDANKSHWKMGNTQCDGVLCQSDVLKLPRASLSPVDPNGLASVWVLDAAVVEPSLVEPAT